jgi:GTPase SAR1 family protein
VLHVHGPGGVGKTTLLHEFVQLAADEGRPVIMLDAREIKASRDVDLLGETDGRAALHGRRECSFIESGASGVFPHDLAREVLIADARWRDADRFRQRVGGMLPSRYPERSS